MKSLEEIKTAAMARHEKSRLEARKRGRKDFPYFPFECSWAYEMQYNREVKKEQEQLRLRRYCRGYRALEDKP